MSHEPPREITVAQCDLVIADCKVRLAPANQGAVLVACRDLITFGRTFNVVVSRSRTEDLQALYLETLLEVPAFFLEAILNRCRRVWKWDGRMPFPAELANLVRDDIAKTRTIDTKAQAMRRKIEDRDRRRTTDSATFWARRVQETGRTIEDLQAEAARVGELVAGGMSAMKAVATAKNERDQKCE